MICKKTYLGGCKNSNSKSLRDDGGFYNDREYTVNECYALCSRHNTSYGKESNCGVFFIRLIQMGEAKKGSCLLYKAGCTNNGDRNFQHYAMTDCTNLHALIAKSNYEFYDLN